MFVNIKNKCTSLKNDKRLLKQWKIYLSKTFKMTLLQHPLFKSALFKYTYMAFYFFHIISESRASKHTFKIGNSLQVHIQYN